MRKIKKSLDYGTSVALFVSFMVVAYIGYKAATVVERAKKNRR